MTKRRLAKVTGYITTAAIFVVGITPGTFNIPVILRPWIFLASIVWFVAFSSGVFSS
jgi:hypothetical protein